jgi:hypothetical protein
MFATMKKGLAWQRALFAMDQNQFLEMNVKQRF